MSQGKEKHIPILDGIRAYAVLLVCFAHFFQVNEINLYKSSKILGVLFFKLSQIGLTGVELFFLLSGFLITGILLESKKSSKYFTTFYARRFLRIFPLYYAVLAISFFVLPFLIHMDAAGKEIIRNQGWLWTYTSNLVGFFNQVSWDSSLNFPWFGHFWSLCVEEHFYIFWPLLIYYSNNKWLPRIMWYIVILSFLSYIVITIFPNLVPILKWSTIRCAGALGIGGLIAWYYKQPNGKLTFFNISKISAIPLLAIFVMVSFIPRQYFIQELLVYISGVLFFAVLLVISLNGIVITNYLLST
jgi:peptidoglycan/LPS O-acetylase OafA/YrhL